MLKVFHLVSNAYNDVTSSLTKLISVRNTILKGQKKTIILDTDARKIPDQLEGSCTATT